MLHKIICLFCFVLFCFLVSKSSKQRNGLVKEIKNFLQDRHLLISKILNQCFDFRYLYKFLHNTFHKVSLFIRITHTRKRQEARVVIRYFTYGLMLRLDTRVSQQTTRISGKNGGKIRIR